MNMVKKVQADSMRTNTSVWKRAIIGIHLLASYEV
jgi:hypothetical protein